MGSYKVDTRSSSSNESIRRDLKSDITSEEYRDGGIELVSFEA